jgi:type-F conjugative transfer system pilin assembly protein TrbC
MAQKKLLLLLIALLISISKVIAEERFEFKKEDMDFAKNLSKRAREFSMIAIKEKWEELKHMQSINSNNNQLDELSANEFYDGVVVLKIFVSNSMNINLLKNYVKQAKNYRAALVFNGLPNGSWRSLTKLIEAITEGNEDGVLIQIDDEAFRQFGIQSVPSFVLVQEPSIFTSKESKVIYDKLVGNIGVKRALNLIASNGELAKDATRILEEVTNGDN